MIFERDMDGLRGRVLAGDGVAVFDLAVRFQQRLDVIEFGVLRYSADYDFGDCAVKDGKKEGGKVRL